MRSDRTNTPFSALLEALSYALDITEAQYKDAVNTYEAVGRHLARPDSLLAQYNPEILPQGSFMLGTMIQPIHEKDDLDIDLVCQLTGKQDHWTQHDLKQAVGNQLKAHKSYRQMIKKPEGRRCWTLIFSGTINYHLDILPCIVDTGYRILLKKAFAAGGIQEPNDLSLRITYRRESNYQTETNHLLWRKSNPFGYGQWFLQQAAQNMAKSFPFHESIRPVPQYKTDKLPLQRIVQILKRHRDVLFEGNEDKPISIIITTLAARAYEQQADIAQGLLEVVERMLLFIEDRYSTAHGRMIKWVENPVNPEENFADKWPDTPSKQQHFYRWMERVKQDLNYATSQQEMLPVREALADSFGKEAVAKAFSHVSGTRVRNRKS